MARAMWKGRIRFGSVDVPVKLYAAVQDRGVHFRLLHEKDLTPVQQEMANPDTGEAVPGERIHKAFEAEDGTLVMLDDAELDALEPEADRAIEISRFVSLGTISHPWYDRPYYLGPDTNASAYFALAEALHDADRQGIAHWVMRKKEYVGALLAEGDYLMLITLRRAGEVVEASELDAPGGRAPDRREVEMATTLVETLAGDLDLAAFADEYRERVHEFVEAKAAGKVLHLPKVKARRETIDLANVLERSIAAARKRKAG